MIGLLGVGVFLVTYAIGSAWSVTSLRNAEIAHYLDECQGFRTGWWTAYGRTLTFRYYRDGSFLWAKRP